MKEARVQPGRFSGIRFLLGIISIFVAVGLTRSIVGHWQKRAVVEEHQEALRREQERNQQLLTRLEEATSSAFIEKEAREKLGLVKEGDTIVLIDKTKLDVVSTSLEEKRPNWKQWWELFF